MYGITTKAGRGSWQMATARLFDDKEKAQAVCYRMRRENANAVFAVVYMGDADLWKTLA